MDEAERQRIAEEFADALGDESKLAGCAHYIPALLASLAAPEAERKRRKTRLVLLRRLGKASTAYRAAQMLRDISTAVFDEWEAELWDWQRTQEGRR